MSTLLARRRSRGFRASVAALGVVVLVSCTGSAGDQPAEAAPTSAEQTSESPTGAQPTPEPTRSSAPSTEPAEPSAPTPGPVGWTGGPSDAEMRRAGELVDAMTLRERAGQVVVASYSGTTPPEQLVRQQHLGGVIVLEENVGDISTLAGRLRRVKSFTEKVNRPVQGTGADGL